MKFTCWEEDGYWVGYLEGYPNYWTQGDTLEDLHAHLRDLQKDLTSGAVPVVPRRGDQMA